MKTPYLPANPPEGQPAVELKRIHGELTNLLILAHELRQQLQAALARIEPAAPSGPELRQVVLGYMRSTSNSQLRKDLLQARGQASVSNLRTRLDRDLEARRGRRHPSNGRAAVHANGNGAALGAE